MIQVKARTIPPKGADTEAAWFHRVATKAMRQAKAP